MLGALLGCSLPYSHETSSPTKPGAKLAASKPQTSLSLSLTALGLQLHAWPCLACCVFFETII